MPKTAYKIKGRKCCICKSDKTYTDSNGKSYWRKYYNAREIWDGKSYMCDTCYKRYDSNSHNNLIKSLRRMSGPIKGDGIDKRTCCRCGSNNTSSNWYRHYDKNDIWDKKSYLCAKCYHVYYYDIIKSVLHCRNMSINDIFSDVGKVAEFVISIHLDIPNLNIEKDNFNLSIDAEHEKYGKIDGKGAILRFGRWQFNTRRKIDCDTYICIGFSPDMENIEIVYIVPNEEYIHDITEISIYKDAYRDTVYYKFYVDPGPWNDTYHKIRDIINGDVNGDV